MKTLMANGLFNGSIRRAGALRVVLAPPRTSAGQIQSLAPAENFPAADSFFDVFVEMDTAAGRLHTNDASHMMTTINQVPETGETYYGPGVAVTLCDESDVPVGEILLEQYIVNQVIACLSIFHRRITLTQAGQITDAAQSGGGGGGGLLTDMARGDLAVMRAEGGNFT